MRSAQVSSSKGAKSGAPPLFSWDQGPRAALCCCSQTAVMPRSSGVLSGIWRQSVESGMLRGCSWGRPCWNERWENLNSAQFIVKVLLFLLLEKQSAGSCRNPITHRRVLNRKSPSLCPLACWPFAFFSSASTDNRVRVLTVMYTDIQVRVG